MNLFLCVASPATPLVLLKGSLVFRFEMVFGDRWESARSQAK